MRNISVASVVLMQVLMTHLTIVNDARPSWLQSERFTRTSGMAALLVALFFSVFTLALPVRQWDDSKKRPGLGVNWSAYPVESARFLKSINYQGPIINSENLGGYLIWEGWPEWKVFADSRMEVGGQGAILLYFEVYNDLDKLASLSDSAGARAAVFTFRHPYTDLFQKMVEDERWALVHLDWNNGVFLRRGGDWEGVINRNEIKDPLSYEISRPD